MLLLFLLLFFWCFMCNKLNGVFFVFTEWRVAGSGVQVTGVCEQVSCFIVADVEVVCM